MWERRLGKINLWLFVVAKPKTKNDIFWKSILKKKNAQNIYFSYEIKMGIILPSSGQGALFHLLQIINKNYVKKGNK